MIYGQQQQSTITACGCDETSSEHQLIASDETNIFLFSFYSIESRRFSLALV